MVEKMEFVALVLSVSSFILAIISICISRSVVRNLDENYWTKEVVGRTINTKVYGDPKRVDICHNHTEEKPRP
jgi:hypothetical protein